MVYPRKWSPNSYRSSAGQRRAAKARRPKTDVLPLDHATNPNSTGTGDRRRTGKLERVNQTTQANSASYPTRDGQSAVMLCGWRVRRLIPYVDKRVGGILAGTTVWSLVNTCQPECFGDEYRSHYKALTNVPLTSLYLLRDVIEIGIFSEQKTKLSSKKTWPQTLRVKTV